MTKLNWTSILGIFVAAAIMQHAYEYFVCPPDFLMAILLGVLTGMLWPWPVTKTVKSN